MERLEGSFLSFDETELFYQVWRPEKETRGFIVLTHGMGEHSECYHQVASDLVQDQWTVYAWDLRGHGRSEGKRGYVSNFADMIQDLKAFTNHFKQETGHPKNAFLFAHSLGGLVLLNFILEEGVEGFKAAILSSPLLGITLPVPKVKEQGAKLLADWLPKFTLHNEIKYTDLHRDHERLKSYENDPLRHDKVSPRLFLGIQEYIKNVESRADEIQLPILFQLAGDDRLVSTPASEQVFDQVGSKQKKLYIYPDCLHEIYNDLEREEVIRNMKSFLQETEEKQP